MLRPEEVGVVVAKIKEVCPRALKEVEHEKFQILVDLFDFAAFKAISAVMDSL